MILALYSCEIYYEGLAYVIMEAEKSHDLLSAAGGPGKPVVWFQSKHEGFRTRGANGINPSQSPKA